MITGEFVFSGYYFADDGPALKLDDLNTGKRHEPRIFDETFTLRSDDDQHYCIGRFELGKGNSIPCPNARKVGPKMETCRECFEAIGFNPSFYHVAKTELSEAQQEYNQQPHGVYLAYFAPGHVKAGIGNLARQQQRWLEQGARLVADLGEFADAYEARMAEERLINSGLNEVVQRVRKRQFLAEKLDINQAREELQSLMTQYSLSGEIRDLSERYRSSVVDDPTDVTKIEPVTVSGHVYAQIGDILVMAQGDSQFMLGLKDLTGRLVIISEETVELQPKQSQASLF